ncbi:hypothetical protein ASE63_10910 [Bosea sp. Root381]|uniref:hypothetical protein n=1 Tax=Bosea sp. Root381 TaxID=1736524 RepID=UPI000701B464|nr:hypothetical protein [Bosea sp. Root381]KRD99998.1 hypothetical protein ASE63_10910 [Bosea sp. Root381]
MSQINTVSLIAARNMSNNARKAMAEAHDDRRLAMLADAVGIDAGDPLFKILVLQHATVEHSRDAQIALLQAAEVFKEEAAGLLEERKNFEKRRRPWELVKAFWMEISLGLATAAIFGMLIGILLMKVNGVPANDGRAAVELGQAIESKVAAASDTASAARPRHS